MLGRQIFLTFGKPEWGTMIMCISGNNCFHVNCCHHGEKDTDPSPHLHKGRVPFAGSSRLWFWCQHCKVTVIRLSQTEPTPSRMLMASAELHGQGLCMWVSINDISSTGKHLGTAAGQLTRRWMYFVLVWLLSQELPSHVAPEKVVIHYSTSTDNFLLSTVFHSP